MLDNFTIDRRLSKCKSIVHLSDICMYILSGMLLSYKCKGMSIANDSTYNIQQSAFTLIKKANLAAGGRY